MHSSKYNIFKNKNQFIILLVVILLIVLFIYHLYFCTAQGSVFNAHSYFPTTTLWNGLGWERGVGWAKIKQMGYSFLDFSLCILSEINSPG